MLQALVKLIYINHELLSNWRKDERCSRWSHSLYHKLGLLPFYLPWYPEVLAKEISCGNSS